MITPKPFSFTAGCNAKAASPTTITTPPFLYDHPFLCLSVAVYDYDHTVGSHIEVGIVSGVARVPVRSQKGPFPKQTSMNTEFPFLLCTGQHIYATVTTPAQGDRLELFAHGYLIGVDQVEERTVRYYSHFGRYSHYRGRR